jgi:hypothetical protein
VRWHHWQAQSIAPYQDVPAFGFHDALESFDGTFASSA